MYTIRVYTNGLIFYNGRKISRHIFTLIIKRYAVVVEGITDYYIEFNTYKQF